LCDYSLNAVKTRDAVVGDKLTTVNFGTGTRGFCSTEEYDSDKGFSQLGAVCLRPGTEIAFDKSVLAYITWNVFDVNKPLPSVAVFTQVNKDNEHIHHDALEFADGTRVLLTLLKEGQRATVLQLPAAPKTKEEAKAQERAAYAG
jgi:hypothetical protein